MFRFIAKNWLSLVIVTAIVAIALSFGYNESRDSAGYDHVHAIERH